jgi:hypothetical protein
LYIFATWGLISGHVIAIAHEQTIASSCHVAGNGYLEVGLAVCTFAYGGLVGAKTPPVVGHTPTSAKIFERHHNTTNEHGLACSDFSLYGTLSGDPNELPITYIDRYCCIQQPVTRD